MEETCPRELASLERSEVPDLHKTAKRNKIRRTAAAHRLQRRRVIRVILGGLYDDDGRLIETAEEAGELLHAHWPPVFAGGQRSDEAQRIFLDNFVRLPPGDDYTWPVGRIAEIARRLPDSTPGPDGLSYAFCGHLPGPWADFLNSVAIDMTLGAPPPPKLLSSYTTNLPKAEHSDGTDG